MLWTELELDREISDDRLRDAWAAAFAVPPDAVAIVDDITTARPSTDPGVRVVLERYGLPGDFPLHVMVILHGEDLDAAVAGQEKTLALVKRLCAALDCRVLISDEGPDPYVRLRVTPTGQVDIVEVDADQLDDNGAFVLAKVPTAAAS